LFVNPKTEEEEEAVPFISVGLAGGTKPACFICAFTERFAVGKIR